MTSTMMRGTTTTGRAGMNRTGMLRSLLSTHWGPSMQILSMQISMRTNMLMLNMLLTMQDLREVEVVEEAKPLTSMTTTTMLHLLFREVEAREEEVGAEAHQIFTTAKIIKKLPSIEMMITIMTSQLTLTGQNGKSIRNMKRLQKNFR